MIGNPDNLGRVEFLRLLSHQCHIANYLGCLLVKETVIGYTVFYRGYRELKPQTIRRTISYYKQQSDNTPGFLIELGDTYCVACNRHRRELFVCGIWVPGNFDDGCANRIIRPSFNIPQR